MQLLLACAAPRNWNKPNPNDHVGNRRNGPALGKTKLVLEKKMRTFADESSY